MTNRNPLKVPLITLVIIFIILLIAGVELKYKNVADYLINISANVLASIITIIFIDFYLNKQEKRVADKREKIAWTILKPIMYSHFSIMFNLYKATTQTKGKNFETKKLDEFFSDNYIETIQLLDVSLKAPVFPDRTWMIYLKQEFEKLNNKYETILDKYSTHMEPDLVEVIESMKSSVFHHHMINGLTTVDGLNKKSGHKTPKDIFGQMFTGNEVIKPYLEILKRFIELSKNADLMKDFFKIDEGHWRNDIAQL